MQDFAELQQNVAQAQRKQDLMNEATDRNKQILFNNSLSQP